LALDENQLSELLRGRELPLPKLLTIPRCHTMALELKSHDVSNQYYL